MSADETASLMHRKARTGRDAQAARAMSLGRALRLTAAKQADRQMGLALSALSVTRRKVGSEGMRDCIEPGYLTLLMDGPGTQVAAAVLDPVLVAGLIQQQTMGKVTAAQEGATARSHTATDAALCAPYIEALLSHAALMPEEAADRDLLKGYRFGVWAQEPRQAQLALEAPAYEVIEMTLDLAAGTRAGTLALVLPEPPRVQIETPDDDDGDQAPAQRVNLAQNVLGLNAELTIALTRLKLPLQRAGQLKVGDVLDLGLSSMAQALVIDANGRVLSRGTLGQIDGNRALQVEQQKRDHHTQPRRRLADRDELDLPDVTAPVAAPQDKRASSEENAPAVPSMSDIDIFGDLDALPELPDMDAAAQAADAQWDASDDGSTQTETRKQAGW